MYLALILPSLGIALIDVSLSSEIGLFQGDGNEKGVKVTMTVITEGIRGPWPQVGVCPDLFTRHKLELSGKRKLN